MITDDELAQLPEDPELAFVEFERIVRARYYEAEREEAETQYGNAGSYRLEYEQDSGSRTRVCNLSLGAMGGSISQGQRERRFCAVHI